MTERVDFYVLKTTDAKDRRGFACRLAEKAYLRDLRVLILSDNLSDAQALDDQLWTFNDRSFVPHALCVEPGPAEAATPVHLIVDLEAATDADLLVNLTDRMPLRLEKFARIAEIVDGDAERRRLGRERFKAYRDLKLELETHQS